MYKKVNFLDSGVIRTIDLKKNKTLEKKIDDPLNWINKKNYNKYKNMKLDHISREFEKLIKKKLNLMKPGINYGSILSGGIDSSLISYFLQKDKKHKLNICLTHGKKDIPANKVLSKEFQNSINYNKLELINVSNFDYFRNLEETYKKFLYPLSSHDLPGRNLISKVFKKKKLRVIFNGDGADELFGGYEIYKNINWNTSKVKILSPYSLINSKNSNQYKNTYSLFKKAYKKYKSFLGHKEALMQSNLFIDYFVQCVGVHNVSNDVIIGENSIESRSPFLNKDIIKFALNLPIKFKINIKSKNEIYVLKPILKRIFIHKFGIKLYSKKQGFPGHPNETFNFLNKKDKKLILSSKKNKYSYNDLNKTQKWKILNIFFYKKFLGRKLNLSNKTLF